MKSNQLVILGAVAVGTLGVAMLLSGRDGAGGAGGQPRLGEPLLAGLEAAINDVDRIRVQSADESEPPLTLTRGAQGWSVVERDGYPADVGRVRELLLALGNAELLEQKTSNPDNYAALGLEDATTVSVEGGTFAGATVAIGDSARRGTATYIRVDDQADTWLVSGQFTVDTAAASWIDPVIVNIPGEDIQSVVITHGDGEVVRIEKAARADTGYALIDIPAGKQLRYESIANPIGSVLASLRLEEVQSTDSAGEPASPVTTARFLTFDGLALLARAWESGEQRWVTLAASVDEEQVARFAIPDDGGETDAPDEASEAPTADGEASASDDPHVRAEALNEQLSPWVYAVGRYKFEQLTRRMDDLVQDPPAEVLPDTE